jgi:hypothetical protein
MAGPDIDIHQLMRRLAQCPPDIYDFSSLDSTGPVPLALAQDVIFHLGGGALEKKDRNHLIQLQTKRPTEAAFLMLGCYVLSHPIFLRRSELIPGCISLFRTGFSELADVSRARDFVLNTERREELVRLCLRSLAIRPSGESKESFKNRWESLDSVRRVELMQKAAQLRKRQEELRKAMEEKAAREAASKWSRE